SVVQTGAGCFVVSIVITKKHIAEFSGWLGAAAGYVAARARRQCLAGRSGCVSVPRFRQIPPGRRTARRTANRFDGERARHLAARGAAVAVAEIAEQRRAARLR